MSDKLDTEKPKDDETRRSPPLKVRRDFLRLAILTGTLGILGRRAGAFLINDVQEGPLKVSVYRPRPHSGPDRGDGLMVGGPVSGVNAESLSARVAQVG